MNQPEPGLYRMRLARGGPLVAAAIFLPCPMVPVDGTAHPDDWCAPLDRPRRLRGEVDGRPCDPVTIWHSRFERIDQAEFLFLRDAAAWDRQHAPSAPAANPDKPIDLLSAPIPTF